jgi:hypothetical protein
MPPPSERERRPGEGAAPGSTAGGRDGISVAVADGYRQALTHAGIDRVPLGVRDHGPLNWTPPDRIEDREPPVAIAHRRVIARRRIAHLERRRRVMRTVLRYWQGAA